MGTSGPEEEDDGFYNDDEEEEHGDFVWDKPILVKECYARHGGLQRSETALPSIILFNLALANHLSAIGKIKTVVANDDDDDEEEEEKGDNACRTTTTSAVDVANANERLRKATELYRLSLQLQTVGSSTQIGELLFLSCLNNLGNACGLLGDDKAEDRAHEQLLSALMYLTQTCSNNDDPQRQQQQRQRQRRQQ